MLDTRITQRFTEKLLCSCGSTSWRISDLNGDLICSNCHFFIEHDRGIYSLIPRERSTNPLENIDYDEAHSVTMGGGQALAKKYLDLCKVGCGSEVDILELGCGTGLLTFGLAEDSRTGHCISVDVSHRFLHQTLAKISKYVGEESNIMLLCADVNRLPFQANSFDFVFGNSILHHIYDYESVLKSAFDLLRPGGCLVFNEPCQQGKSIVAFFLRLMLRYNALLKDPVFTPDEAEKIEGIVHVQMREKICEGRQILKEKMEDKHIFRTSALSQVANQIGFQKFENHNVTKIEHGYRTFVERTLHTAGLHRDLEAFAEIFSDFDDLYLHFFRDEMQTPHQFLVFQR